MSENKVSPSPHRFVIVFPAVWLYDSHRLVVNPPFSDILQNPSKSYVGSIGEISLFTLFTFYSHYSHNIYNYILYIYLMKYHHDSFPNFKHPRTNHCWAGDSQWFTLTWDHLDPIWTGIGLQNCCCWIPFWLVKSLILRPNS